MGGNLIIIMNAMENHEKFLKPSAVGVTLSTPSYRPLAVEAAARWRRHTGLPCLVIDAEDGPEAYGAKFLISLLGPVKVCFFDADWWLVRRPPIEFLWRDGRARAVSDPGVGNPECFVHRDCVHWSIPFAAYFNTGFFAVDLNLATHRLLFEEAWRIAAEIATGELPAPRDSTEQSILNLAAIRARTEVEFLSSQWNHFVYGDLSRIPEGVFAGHAAGMALEHKAAVLADFARACGD